MSTPDEHPPAACRFTESLPDTRMVVTDLIDRHRTVPDLLESLQLIAGRHTGEPLTVLTRVHVRSAITATRTGAMTRAALADWARTVHGQTCNLRLGDPPVGFEDDYGDSLHEALDILGSADPADLDDVALADIASALNRCDRRYLSVPAAAALGVLVSLAATCSIGLFALAGGLPGAAAAGAAAAAGTGVALLDHAFVRRTRDRIPNWRLTIGAHVTALCLLAALIGWSAP